MSASARDLKHAAFRQILFGVPLNITILVTWAGADGGTFRCKVIKFGSELCVVSADRSFGGIFKFDPALDEWDIIPGK